MFGLFAVAEITYTSEIEQHKCRRPWAYAWLGVAVNSLIVISFITRNGAFLMIVFLTLAIAIVRIWMTRKLPTLVPGFEVIKPTPIGKLHPVVAVAGAPIKR